PDHRCAVGSDPLRRGPGAQLDRVLADDGGFNGVPGMTPADCRIDLRRSSARWDPDAEVTAAEAMDFWAFAAGAANVVMQLSWPEVGYGVAERKGGSGRLSH